MITIPNKLKKEVYKMDYTPEDRWIRRGHTRKPNAIVRGCYAFSDWLGDFAPMLATAKQGALNAGLIIANFIILIGILITSAVHSLELLRYAGAKGGLEYVMLIVFEAVFLVSSFLVDQAVKRGMSFKQSWQVWLPFFIGLVFVFFSNFLSMDTNLAGMLIGGITPFLLLFIKWMLDWQVNVRGKFDEEKRAERAKKVAEIIAESTQKSEKNLAENVEENVEENNAQKTEDKTETSPSVSSDSANKNLKKNDQKRLQKATQKDVRKPEESDAKKAAESEQKTEKTSKKSSKKSARNRKKRTRNRDREIQKAVEVIKKELEETGKIPTYATISTLAKTTKHYAQQAKKLVEAELKQKEAQQQEQQQEEKQLLEKAS